MDTYGTFAAVVSADQIVAFVDRIAVSFKPPRIVLFGSYACGSPTDDSDVDLLITRRRWSMSPLTAAGRIRVELGVPFSMDLIVRSEADLQRRIAAGDGFLRELLETGITLYAADDARVGGQGRIRLRRSWISSLSTRESDLALVINSADTLMSHPDSLKTNEWDAVKE